MKKSAGILLYRKQDEIEVLLVHPGGPLWKNEDAGAWSVPKGEINGDDEPLATAIREFEEELGSKVKGNFLPLIPVKQRSGKLVYAWAVEGSLDVDKIKSNLFEMEWPPRSGKRASFPEIDKAAWFTISDAREKIISAQEAFLNELAEIITN
jgi:predicted NUDIX family NTP pyrophosphohydrolase